jgi:predicted transcriptional regulator
MTREVIFGVPDVEISPAVTIMLDNAIFYLPVVEKGNLGGIVTSTDLIIAVQRCLHVPGNTTQAVSRPAATALRESAPGLVER